MELLGNPSQLLCVNCINLLDGNLNTVKKTTEVLLDARWEDRLEEDGGTAVSNYVISMVLWVNDQLDAQLRCIKLLLL